MLVLKENLCSTKEYWSLSKLKIQVLPKYKSVCEQYLVLQIKCVFDADHMVVHGIVLTFVKDNEIATKKYHYVLHDMVEFLCQFRSLPER